MFNTDSEVVGPTPHEIYRDTYASQIKHTLGFQELQSIGEGQKMPDYHDVDDRFQRELKAAVKAGANAAEGQNAAMEIIKPWVVGKIQEGLRDKEAAYDRQMLGDVDDYDNLRASFDRASHIANFRERIGNMAAYQVDDKERQVLVKKYKEEQRPVVISAVKERIAEVRKLQQELGATGRDFVPSELDEEKTKVISRANNAIQLARTSYGVRPEEIDETSYNTFVINQFAS